MSKIITKPNKKEVTTVLGKDIHSIIRRNSDKKKYDEYRDLWRKSLSLEFVPDYPIQIDFELNYSCNFTCPMCTWSAENNSNKGKTTWLSFDVFKETIDEGVDKGLKAIRLNYINEPLIRKDIIKYIEYAKKKGILDIYMSSNGSLLTSRISEELIRSGLTRLQISLDAFTEETYKKIRTGPGADYKKIINNILNFLKIRDKLNSELPTLRVNFVKTETNNHELNDFINFWTDKADCIGIQDFINIMNPSVNEQEDDLKEFKCSQPFNHMTIRYDGSILPCCTFFGAKLPLGKLNTKYENSLSKVKTLENIDNEKLEKLTIEQAWKGAKITDIRKIHHNGNFSKIDVCKQCVLSTSQTDD